MFSKSKLPMRPPGGASASRWASRSIHQLPSSDVPTTLPLINNDPQPGIAVAWDSPPRQLSSSWEGLGSDNHSTKSNTVKPSQAILQLVDVEREETMELIGEEAVARKEENARQMALAVGAEKLYDVFQKYNCNSHVAVEQLPEVFEASGLIVSKKHVEAAIATICPEATCNVTYQQCQELFLYLQVERHREVNQEQQLVKAGRFARCIAGLSDKDSTNLLLVLVVTLCFISAFLAGGLAILLLVLDDTSNVKNYLQENLGIMQDNLEVYARKLAVEEGNQRQAMFTTTLSSVLQYTAYAAAVDTNREELLHVTTSVANTLGGWWISEPQQTFMHYASLSALLANASVVKYGLNSTASLFDEVNGGMPDGFELQLGKWKTNSTSAVEYLTQFAAGTSVVDANTTSPMRAALSGTTSASMAVDYREASVYTGYTRINSLGVQVNLKFWTLLVQRFNQLVVLLNSWTADSSSWEFMLGYMPTPGVRSLLSALPGCDATCMEQIVAEGMPLSRALNGETGTMTYTNFRGVKSVVAYAPLPNTQCGLAVHMAFSDIVTRTLHDIASLLDNLNSNYPYGSEEFELTNFTTHGNTTNFTHLSAYSFGDQCPSGQCVLATEYVKYAAQNCSSGVMRTNDYRGTPVVVSYACISELNAVLSAKVDLADWDSEMLSTILEAVNFRTAKDNATSAQFLVATPKSGLTADEVKGYGDFEVLSQLKYPGSCANLNCTWNRESALRALKDLKDVVDTRDYRNVEVMAAPSRSTAIGNGIGLAVELDHTEALKSTYDTGIRVGCFAIGIVTGCTILLVILIKLMLASMIKAKEEGNQAVEEEKDRFSKLVASMYPQFVVPRLLEGEKQMVCEVPGAAVFFSDIHEFTSASNTMGSQELLQLMGYVYGVMDCVASRFGVFKVKTIGDAYLAVRGLPGCDSENPSLELLRFASFVCQVFGDRFVHPTEGQVLALMNRAMQWTGPLARKQRLPKQNSRLLETESEVEMHSPGRSSRPSKVQAGSRASLASSKSKSEDRVQCVMSYGLAVGRIVAGVLAGRCPMFDIWGITVNLASRMQSTGEPGRIQVSEHLYKKVIAVPEQPFSFEAPRTTFCKGFGNVNAYMVRNTTEGLPKDLQDELRLEPRYGAFRFENILTSTSQRQVAEKPGQGTKSADSPQVRTDVVDV